MAETKTTKATEKPIKLNAMEKRLKDEIIGKVARYYGKTIQDASPHMIYNACAFTVRDQIMEKWTKSHEQVKKQGSKKLDYLSFEFLMGRL